MAANVIITFLFYLLITLGFVPCSARLITANANFIASTCSKTTRPAYCVSTLWSVRRSINATTVQELAGISLEITLSHASWTLSTTTNLADQSAGTPVEEPLNTCIQIYSNAIDDLKEAQDDLGSQDYDGALTLVDQAEDAPGNCEGGFTDVKSPITQQNQSVKDHCRLSSDLLDLLSS